MKPRPRPKAKPERGPIRSRLAFFEPVRAAPVPGTIEAGPGSTPMVGLGTAVRAAPVPGTIEGIDAEIVRLARALARRNLELGQRLQDFAAIRRWARVGFSSLGAYARERLGLSLS